ncbi:PRC-barrel domain-containing protein [bacterium]|nr:PRC-barrel domain-containing protein [bacterium]
MRSWLKDIKGMWVATYTEGVMLGTVNSIYLDLAEKKVVGLVLRTGTPLAGEDSWVAIEDVKKIGVDLVFLPNESVVSKGEPQGKRMAQLVAMSVSSKDGRSLGQLADIEVDRDTWKITELGLNNNLSVDVDPVETVFGEDLILVQAGAQAQSRVSVKPKDGFIDSVLGKDFMKQTTNVFKKVLKGNEADLFKQGKKETKTAEESPAPSQDDKEA